MSNSPQYALPITRVLSGLVITVDGLVAGFEQVDPVSPISHSVVDGTNAQTFVYPEFSSSAATQQTCAEPVVVKPTVLKPPSSSLTFVPTELVPARLSDALAGKRMVVWLVTVTDAVDVT